MKSHLILTFGLFGLTIASTLNAQELKIDKVPANPGKANEPSLDLNTAKEADSDVKLDASIPNVEIPADAAPSATTRANSAARIAGLEHLTEEQTKTVSTNLKNAGDYLRGVRWQEALEKLNDVEKITGEMHLVENMRGAVFTRMRDFKQARSHFEKAVSLTKSIAKERFHPRFNLAEIDFVEKKWEPARTSFESLLADVNPDDKSSGKLMRFKMYICVLQQMAEAKDEATKKKAEASANVLMQAFDQYDAEAPAFYFANAARFFAEGKKEEANEWLESASKIYPKDVTETYNDSFIEMGWLETLGQ